MNTITLNGKTYDISDDLAEKLADEIKEQETRDAVAKPEPYQEYFFMHNDGRICRDIWTGDSLDTTRYNLGNVCTDRDLLQQRAYAETLSRLLWRYAMRHKFPMGKPTWTIHSDGDGFTAVHIVGKNYAYDLLGRPIFTSREITEGAIEVIIKPFLREHPDFRWREA